MSIQTEITRITEAKMNISAAISAKGVEIPAGTKIDGLAALIASILTQKPEQAKTVSPALTQQVIAPDAGKALSSVTVEALTKDVLAALDENFKAGNIREGASILGLAGAFSPFAADLKVADYKIVTSDYTGTATASGEKVMLHENLGWTPHLTLSLLVSDPNEAYPVAPDGYVAFTGVLDMRHWNPLNTKIVMFSFARTGQETKWWVTRADMEATDSDSAWYQARWADQRCIIGHFHGTGYALHTNTRWLTLMLRFEEPTVTLTAPTGLTINNSSDSASGTEINMIWNRSAISGGEGIVYLLYRDGTLINRVNDSTYEGTLASLSFSATSDSDSGAYTVRAYNSYAGLSEPSNSVTFTYQA